jgi:phosphoenolpyruvate synthase/pyruvate phosphate dikinase
MSPLFLGYVYNNKYSIFQPRFNVIEYKLIGADKAGIYFSVDKNTGEVKTIASLKGQKDIKYTVS